MCSVVSISIVLSNSYQNSFKKSSCFILFTELPQLCLSFYFINILFMRFLHHYVQRLNKDFIITEVISTIKSHQNFLVSIQTYRRIQVEYSKYRQQNIKENLIYFMKLLFAKQICSAQQGSQATILLL